MSTRTNIDTFHAGETWIIDVTCRDAAGAPINLTGAQIAWRLKRGGQVALDVTLGTGITVVSAAAGTISIRVTPAMQTAANITAQHYSHELRITTADGTVSTQTRGAFLVQPSLFA